MGGFFRFAGWFALLLGVFVLVVLPLLLSPLLTAMVREMGLRSQTLDVSVAMLDPSLLFGRSRRVSLVATDVDASPARIGHLQLALGEASYFDRSFETVSGELRDVSVTIGRGELSASSIVVNGPASAASITARLSAGETEALIRAAATRAGLSVESVRLSESGVTVSLLGHEGEAGIRVRAGALLLEPQGTGPVVLIQSAPADPWSLNESWISDRGLNISGTVDMTRLVRSLSATETAP